MKIIIIKPRERNSTSGVGSRVNNDAFLRLVVKKTLYYYPIRYIFPHLFFDR
jgi:hypothetical protein